MVRLAPGFDAALVDIGDERPGFSWWRPEPRRISTRARAWWPVRQRRSGKGAPVARIVPRREVIWHGSPTLRPARSAGSSIRRRASRQRLPAPAATEHILADDPAVLRELRDAFPAAEIAHRGVEEWPVDLNALVDAALVPTLALTGCRSLHIEETRAAVLIDVDTGTPEAGSAARAALAVNLAAAAAIARQLRLRQLGGGIVVDFVGLDGSRPRERVRRRWQPPPGDPAQPQVLGWTRLGHLELVRPRRAGPERGNARTARRRKSRRPGLRGIAALHREARAQPAANWRLAASPAVAAALHGPAAQGLRALETRLGRRVALAVEPRSDAHPFDIAPL